MKIGSRKWVSEWKGRERGEGGRECWESGDCQGRNERSKRKEKVKG